MRSESYGERGEVIPVGTTGGGGNLDREIWEGLSCA